MYIVKGCIIQLYYQWYYKVFCGCFNREIVFKLNRQILFRGLFEVYDGCVNEVFYVSMCMIYEKFYIGFWNFFFL